MVVSVRRLELLNFVYEIREIVRRVWSVATIWNWEISETKRIWCFECSAGVGLQHDLHLIPTLVHHVRRSITKSNCCYSNRFSKFSVFVEYKEYASETERVSSVKVRKKEH